jgi:hypothetical protein
VTVVALVHGVVEPELELHWFSPVRSIHITQILAKKMYPTWG